jgi:hypothetical protein
VRGIIFLTTTIFFAPLRKKKAKKEYGAQRRKDAKKGRLPVRRGG